MTYRIFILLWMACLGPWFGLAGSSDPIEEVKYFSAFNKVDLQQLSDGKILAEPGPSMDFQRGISAQACYVVKAPAEETARLILANDASHHESLKIYLHSHLQSPPSDKDFLSLNLNSEKSYLRRLATRTQATKADRPDLNLSLAEAKLISEAMKNGREPSEVATSCWRDILKARASKFHKEGLRGMPAYENGRSPIRVEQEIKSLLEEDPKVMKQFSQFLSETFFAKHPPENMSPAPYHYLDLRDVDSRATFNLGAIYLKSSPDQRQLADCTYYSSSGFYASCTLRQVWPIKIKDQNASLVWRGEYVSSSSLADHNGIEAMAAPAILTQELKKTIRFFQEDVAKTH